MAEYINRGTLKDSVSSFMPPRIDDRNQAYVDGLTDAYILICRAPAADVVERKTGTWISYIEDGYLECPFCGAATNCDGDESELRFCFSCGAELEGVRNDV